MKTLRNIVTFVLIMATLFCFTAVIADGSAEKEPERKPGVTTGTYNSYTWTFDAAQGSRDRIKSIGTYAVYDYLQLIFLPVFGSYAADGVTLLYFNSEGDYTVNYGPYNQTTISTSYSIYQVAVYLGIQTTLPSGYKFVSCRYKFKIDSYIVCNQKKTYMS